MMYSLILAWNQGGNKTTRTVDWPKKVHLPLGGPACLTVNLQVAVRELFFPNHAKVFPRVADGA